MSIMVDPERWQRFKEKWLAKGVKLPTGIINDRTKN